MIKLDRLTKKFGDFTAVENLCLDIRPGDFFGFLGPNGAGKTTTIKMITGLTAASSGTITINGFDIHRQPLEAKSTLGYIPDQPFLYDKLTGREFLHFSGGLYRLDHDRLRQRVNEYAELFELDSWLDQRTEYYSQGMRQRIVIVAALLHEPKTLVIDEPMVGLDPRGVRLVKRLLEEKASCGMSIFMSTHSLPVVEELCNRIAIINHGKLIFEGPSGEFLRVKATPGASFESIFLELTQ
jgi:ABC-2 type transport system ATP-binding protein